MSHHWWRASMHGGSGAVLTAAPEGSAARGGAVAFSALMAFVVISLIAPQTFVPALASVRPALLTAVVAIVTLLASRLVERRPLVASTRETRVAAALAGWAIATAPFSAWPGGSVTFLLDTYFKTLAVFWLLGIVIDTRARLRLVAWTLSLTAIPLAVTGVRNYLAGTFVPDGGHVGVKRILGYDAPLTENPNDLALMLNLILPLTVALLFIQRRRSLRLLLAGAVLVDVLAVIVTLSRAGFLTLATAVVLYCWRLGQRAERGWAVVAMILTLAAIPFLPSGYLDRLGTVASIDSDPTGSAQARWTDTVAAATFVLAHPIVGAGVGMNVLALNAERGPSWKAVHNVYLELAVELGLPGLSLFLLLLLGAIRRVGLVRRRAAGDPGARDLFHLAEGLQVSLVAFAVAALFHPVAYHFYFYELAGLAVAMQAVSRAPAPTSEGDPRIRASFPP
ncbi:MAG: O-antigen ligase family protein [Candidatus Rokubacteria bacterium]|nr:O-antigen ligase family protein [Candidatus Rokubacteria bacterium]